MVKQVCTGERTVCQSDFGERIRCGIHLESDAVPLRALILYKILRLVVFVKPCQKYVVGRIHRSCPAHDRVAAVLCLKSVSHGFGAYGRCHGDIKKSDVLAAVPVIVAVVVCQRENAVCTLLQVAYCKLAILVGLCYALHRQSGHGGVAEIGIHAHKHALRRFEIACLKHHAADLQRVDMAAGREGERKPSIGLPSFKSFMASEKSTV